MVFLAIFAGTILLAPSSPVQRFLQPKKFAQTEKQKQAIIYYDSKQWEEARALLEELVEEHPDNPLYIYMLGATYGRLGYPQKAIGKFKRVIEISPDHHEAHGSLASIYYKYGEEAAENGYYEKARDYFKMAEGKIAQALSIEPEKLAYQEIQKQIFDAQERLP